MNSSDQDQFAAVVVGSGFGGTVAALSFAKLFVDWNRGKPRENWDVVCVLERGQWWLSHEIPTTRRELRGPPTNIREYLEDNDEPFGVWAHPDNVKGLTRLMSMARLFNLRGLYDFRPLSDQVRVLCASGVGGGSLVYSNVTVRPPDSVWAHWPTERDAGTTLGDYFQWAEKFIGTNKIDTIAGLTAQKLERSKIFQDATRKALAEHARIVNPVDRITGALDLALPLSITDVPAKLFDGPSADQIAHFRDPIEQNVCQRQGRCNLGCLPGARHTLNKRLYRAITDKRPLVVKALCEAQRIEYRAGEAYPYIIEYVQTRRGNAGEDVVERKRLSAKRLVVAAGTMGTNELLMRSAQHGLALSPQLGEGFSPNGDLLGYALLRRRVADITRGPINTSYAWFGREDRQFWFSIEDTAISQMVAAPFATFLELYSATSSGTGRRRKPSLAQRLALIRRFPSLAFAVLFFGVSFGNLQKILKRTGATNLPMLPFAGTAPTAVKKRFRRALRFREDDFRGRESPDSPSLRILHTILNATFSDQGDPFASAAKRLERFVVFSGMGIDRADGRLFLKGGELHVDWDATGNAETFRALTEGMRTLARAIDAEAEVFTPTWSPTDASNRSVDVLHPLGGCCMGDDIGSGVVDSMGRVFLPDASNSRMTYPEFYVMDGSIIPGALGVNSSLTISAVAFRCIENALQSELTTTGITAVNARSYWPP